MSRRRHVVILRHESRYGLRWVAARVWLALLVLFAILTSVTVGGAQTWTWIGMLVLVFGGLAVLLYGARER